MAAGPWTKSFQRGRTVGGATHHANHIIQKDKRDVIKLEPSVMTGASKPRAGAPCHSVMTLAVVTTPEIADAIASV